MKKIEVSLSKLEGRVLHDCPLSEEPFYENPGEPVFKLDGTPVSPRHAQKQGYVISKSFVLPEGVTSRVELSAFLTDKFGLERNSSEFKRIYAQYGNILPRGDEPRIY